MLDLSALARAPLMREPFDHIVVPDLLVAETAASVRACFPLADFGGVVPAHAAGTGDALDRLLHALRAAAFSAAMAEKFGVALSPDALLLTLRSRCRKQDGSIHTDSADKVVTALLYLNETWPHAGGRLRILRSATDIEDAAAEVAPLDGTLVAFRRSDHSFHGHLPHEGVRRYVMINWMRSSLAARRETLRHTVSAGAKRLATWAE
jgi:SM-20-related protein